MATARSANANHQQDGKPRAGIHLVQHSSETILGDFDRSTCVTRRRESTRRTGFQGEAMIERVRYRNSNCA